MKTTVMPENDIQSPRGTGDSENDFHQRSDTRLLVRAVESGWPIPAAERQKITAEMTKIASDPATKPRTRSMAVRVLAQLDSLNLRDKHHVERLQHEAGILDLRMQRAEAGKPNDSVAVLVTPVEELPLPEALRGYRKRILEPGGN